MSDFLSALIEKQQRGGAPSKVKPRSSASLRRAITALANQENERVPAERRVTQRDVEVVASRALTASVGLDRNSRYFAAYREVASFITLAIDGKAPVRGARHRDLLPVGHPLSTRKHAMTASALDEATARWIAADPRIHDDARALVAAAYTYPLFTVEQTHAVAQIAALEPGLVPQDILVNSQVTTLLAVGIGGNSSAARSARARLQRRDDEGRFAFMGGLFSFLLRAAGSDKITSVIGKIVGNSPLGEDYVEIQVKGHSELPDGVYEMPVGKGKFLSDENVKAVLPESALPDGPIDPKGRPVVDMSELKKLDAPAGWELVEEKKEGDKGPDKVFRSFDGYRVEVYEPGNPDVEAAVKKAWQGNKGLSGTDSFLPQKANALGEGGMKPFDKNEPIYIAKRDVPDLIPSRTVGIAQDWGFIQRFVQEDEEAFDAAVAKANEVKANLAKASEQAKAQQEKEKAESDEVKKKNQEVREQVEANLANGKDQFGNDLPDGWVATKNEQALNPGWVAKYGDEEIVKDLINLNDVAVFNKEVEGVNMQVAFIDGKPVFEGAPADDWASVEKQIPEFIEANKKMRREDAAEAIAQYDDGQIAKMILDGEADAEMVRQMLQDNPAWVSAMQDLDTSWAVDLPSKDQKEGWNKLRDILKKIDALPDVESDDDDSDVTPEPDVPSEPEPQPEPAPTEKAEPAEIDWDVPEGAFKLFKPEEYEPEGRIDEDSPDFTDDPKVLANKFGEQELIDALAEAVLGKKSWASEFIDELLEIADEEEEGGKKKPGPKPKKPAKKISAGGYGRLDFQYGEEMVPGEAIYNALIEQGGDAELILAQLYDLGLGENKNVDKLNDARSGEEITADDGIEILDEFDGDIFDEAEELIALNEWLAKPDVAVNAVAQIQAAFDAEESNEQIVKMANLLNGFDVDVDLPALLAVNIDMAFSDDKDKVQAFKGLFALLLHADGGYTTKGEESILSNAVRDALREYYGSDPSQQQIDDFFEEFGYYKDLMRGKELIADGDEDIFNNDTLAAAMYRLIAAMSKPNEQALYRGIQLSPDAPELEKYLDEGGFVGIDPRAFSPDKVIAGNFAGVFSPNKDKVAVIFTIPAGQGNEVDIAKFSPFPLENERVGWGNFKVASVKKGVTPDGKVRYNVELRKLSKREAVLEGYDEDYAPLLGENETIDNLPNAYYEPNVEPFEPGNFSEMPEGFDDSPLYIARMWESEDLIQVFRAGVEDGDGVAILEYPIEDGFDAQVPIEAIRDALWIQGFNPNEILRDIADTEGEPDAAEPLEEATESTVVNPVNDIVDEVKEVIDISGWTQKTGALGSNEGGFYEDEEGNRYYVKKAKSPLHAQNEVLASALYRALGIDAAVMYLGQKDGDFYTLSPDIENSKQDLKSRLNDPEYKKKLQEGFAVDAWLANWDVGGLVYDNVMSDGDGNPVRVDPGGALFFRAMGAPKGGAFSGTDVPELDTLRDKNMNAVSFDIFGDMSEEDQIEAARKLLDISHFEIDELVDATIENSDLREKMKEILKGRRQVILERYGLQGDDSSLIAETVEIEDEDEVVPDGAEPIDLTDVPDESVLDDGDAGLQSAAEIEDKLTALELELAENTVDNPQQALDEIDEEISSKNWSNDLATQEAVDNLNEYVKTLRQQYAGAQPEEAPAPVEEMPSTDNPYKFADGTPIEIGQRVVYKGQEGVVVKYDKGNTNYVYVLMDGESKPKVKSAKKISPVGDGGDDTGGDGGGGTEPDAPEPTPTPAAEPVLEPAADSGPEASPEKPEPGSSGNTTTIDVNQDVREQAETAAANGDIIRFYYNGKIREVAVQSVWDNPKNGNVNVYGEDLGDGQKKNFTVSKFEAIPEDAPEPEVTVDEVDQGADQPASNETKDAIYKLLETKDLGSEPGMYVNVAASPFLTEGEAKDLREKLEALPDKSIVPQVQPQAEREAPQEEVEEVAPPEPADESEPTLENAAGNEIYGGVEVVDKKGNQGVVLKVNKDDYAFVQFDDGKTGWRSVKTLSTTGQIKDGVAPAPKIAKPKAGKVTPAGAPVVVIENPDSWDKSNFEGVPSLLDAMSVVQNSDDKTAAMRGASAAVDSDSIEDLDVRVMRVRDENGTDGLRFKFKLTAWAGNAKAKELLALSKEEANAQGITRSPSMKIERIDIGPDGIGNISTDKPAYTANGGYSWKITTPDGIVINFHRGNTEGTNTVPKGNGTRAFHNTVEIQAPAGATPQQIQDALQRAGVVDARPATQADAEVLAENRLISVLGGRTDATKNPKGAERDKILSDIKDRYGIVAEDVKLRVGASGRVETSIDEEFAREIVEATGNPQAIQHNITVPYGASNEMGGDAVWIARLLATPQGGLLSTTTRWTEGIGGHGMSSHTDVGTGGADYVFTKPVANASALEFGSSHYVMYFDPVKVYQRLDFYANYTDSYGARKTTQDVIKAAKTGAYEVMFKHRLAYDDMIAIVVPSIEQKNAIIAELKKMGITQIGGKPIEAAVTVGKQKEPS